MNEDRLNRLLADWARQPAGDEGFAQRMEDSALTMAHKPWQGWRPGLMAGGLLAASVAVAALLLAPGDRAIQPVEGETWSFVALHVPTVDEEYWL